MQAVINPGQAVGNIKAPASKSMMQRVCAAALLHKGKTIIQNPGNSDDDNAAISIIQQLGARLKFKKNNTIEIISEGINPIGNTINCGESGLAARLFAPIAALSSKPICIDGNGSLLQRTMRVYETVLPALGVTLKNFSGHLPFTVQGPLQPQDVTLDGSVSSQFLSGVLFAMCNSTTGIVTIKVTEPKSKPYIDLTLEVLAAYGKIVTHTDYHTYIIDPSKFENREDVAIRIETDWSSAAYWFVAAAIGGRITIEGINRNTRQADKAILDVLEQAGVGMIKKPKEAYASRTVMKPFSFDATECPDLFPILAIMAACCDGDSAIHGLHRLVHKESNRVESITNMLDAFAVPYSIEGDDLCIKGISKLESIAVDSYNDHRIAMAASIGALRANGPVTVNGAEAVSKSYPDFYKHLISLGVNCSLTD